MNKKIMKLATRGKRFGAFCIDAAAPAASTLIIIISSAVMAFRSMMFGRGGLGGLSNDPFQLYGYGYGYNTHSTGGYVAAIIIALLLMLAYIIVEIVFFTRSQTLGKAALGLKVVSSKDGSDIGFWKMLLREWIVKDASASVFLLGYIWILIDDKNRGWHDKILDTFVVDIRESEALRMSTGTYNTESDVL